MKANREQVLAMAREAVIPWIVLLDAPDQLEAFAHKLQQFTLDQLMAQGANLGFGCIARIPETLE